MRYTDEEIRDQIADFVVMTGQPELRYVIPFCLGFYGYVSNQIWRVITELMKDEIIEG